MATQPHHVITYQLSHTAQRDAARAGLPAERLQEIPLPTDLIPQALDLGGEVAADGSVILSATSAVDATGTDDHKLPLLQRRPDDAADALEMIASLIAQGEKRGAQLRAAAQARIDELLVPIEHESHILVHPDGTATHFHEPNSRTVTVRWQGPTRAHLPHRTTDADAERYRRATAEASKARNAAVTAAIAEALPAVRAAAEADDRACAAAAAAERTARAQLGEWLVDRGARLLEQPHLARAVSEGRSDPAVGAARGAICGRVCAAIDEIAQAQGCHGSAATYGEQPFRGLPTPRTYALIDALAEGRGIVAAAALLPGAEVEIGELRRWDVAESGSAVYRLGVEVTVRHPWLDDRQYSTAVLVDAPPSDKATDY